MLTMENTNKIICVCQVIALLKKFAASHTIALPKSLQH